MIGFKKWFAKQNDITLLMAPPLVIAEAAYNAGKKDSLPVIQRAFELGKIYWQQADSESWRQNKKSYETLTEFKELKELTN